MGAAFPAMQLRDDEVEALFGALGGFDRGLQIAERTSQEEPALCELRSAARAPQKGDVDAAPRRPPK